VIFVCLALLAAALVLVLVGIISSSVGAAVAALVCAVAGTGLLLAVYAAYRQRMLAEGTATDVEPVRAPSPAVVAAGGPDCWVVVGFYDHVAVRTLEGWRLSSVTLTAVHQENADLLPRVMAAASER
jgi:hypothetical protein